MPGVGLHPAHIQVSVAMTNDADSGSRPAEQEGELDWGSRPSRSTRSVTVQRMPHGRSRVVAVEIRRRRKLNAQAQAQPILATSRPPA